MNYLNTLLELNRLRKQAKFSPERIKELQDQKLRRLLHYAWEHSAYYRRTFEYLVCYDSLISDRNNSECVYLTARNLKDIWLDTYI